MTTPATWLAERLGAAPAEARVRLAARGLPDRRDPSWRYSDPRRLTGAPGQAAARERLALPPAALRYEASTATIDPALLPTGAALAARAATASAAPGHDGFEDLNAALAPAEHALRLGRGADRPLRIVHSAAGDAYPRLAVELEAGATATVHELCAASAGLTDAVVRIRLGEGATLTWVQVQDAALAARHVAAFDVEVGAGARLVLHSYQLGADAARFAARVRLNGAGAQGELAALTLVEGRRQVDQYLEVAHLAPDTTSRQRYRGIADGRGRAAATCRAAVAPGAVRSDAGQSVESLLLSPHAEADARPELEILCDDVRCAHGATVGQLDEAALFYLLSRGLPRAEARALLVFAFADAILAGLDDPALRGAVEGLLRARLPTELAP